MMRRAIRPMLVIGAAAFVLAACSSGTPLEPPAQLLSAVGTGADRSSSSMAPDAAQQNLLYVSDLTAGDVYVYSYPQGKPEGKLTGFSGPFSICTNTSGNVWILDTHAGEILEYAHGGTKPIAKLEDAAYWASDCAVDPKTGNVAVANVFTAAGEPTPGNLMVYPKGKGKPRTYTDPNLVNFMYVTYDDAGNLFVDGFGTQGNNFALAELPSGKSALVDVKLNQSIAAGDTADVAWDGKYVAVGDAATNAIYQFVIRGNRGKKVGTTRLHGETSGFLGHFCLPVLSAAKNAQATSVIVPNNTSVGFWSYPSGGSPAKTLGTTFIFASGAAVSPAR